MMWGGLGLCDCHTGSGFVKESAARAVLMRFRLAVASMYSVERKCQSEGMILHHPGACAWASCDLHLRKCMHALLWLGKLTSVCARLCELPCKLLAAGLWMCQLVRTYTG